MDMIKVGGYIRRLRKDAGLTQKDLAEKLGVSFQAVSKWENGDALPDTGLLPALCETLNTTADNLLNGGSLLLKNRKLMRVDDVIEGFEHMEAIGRAFGEHCTFYTGMVEGVNRRMDIDLISYLSRPDLREVLWAEVLIQGFMAGRTVDMDEVRARFTNEKMVREIEKRVEKTARGARAE
ncbi:MAG: helix-turn-helix transcriptional regulator [Clostridia bacterium]|nr:helix-turn-helix transcriptional regulator [Clostridia bacterium]